MKLDTRDLGGHLDITRRARAATLTTLVTKATSQVHMIRHLDAFRTAIVRACWPRKLPMAHPLALLSLLDAPDGCDHAFCVIWGWFRQMRRYLGYRLGEVHGGVSVA